MFSVLVKTKENENIQKSVNLTCFNCKRNDYYIDFNGNKKCAWCNINFDKIINNEKKGNIINLSCTKCNATFTHKIWAPNETLLCSFCLCPPKSPYN